jgi:diguanylate cyclase (GGDEF)-like protein
MPARSFRPTHVVPAGGIAYWSTPDISSPSAGTLPAGVQLDVVRQSRMWAEVRWHNGWTSWVDARELVSLRRPFECRSVRSLDVSDVPLLPNRGLLDTRLEKALTSQRSHGGLIVVTLLDVDEFTSVNDTYGITGANQVLVELALSLALVMTDDESVTRMGGDEFVVVSERVHAEKDAALLASRLLACVAQPIYLGCSKLQISCSIGVAIGHGTETPNELMRSAIVARYQAKRHGRATYAMAENLS